MYFVYILKSLKDEGAYVGYTDDVDRRLKQHNSGWVKSTKHRRPLKLFKLETFESKREAKHRERYWKSGGGRRKLKKLMG